MVCVINPCVQGICIREYPCTWEYVELGYLGYLRQSKDPVVGLTEPLWSRMYASRLPFFLLLLQLIKNMPGPYQLHATRWDISGETKPSLNPTQRTVLLMKGTCKKDDDEVLRLPAPTTEVGGQHSSFLSNAKTYPTTLNSKPEPGISKPNGVKLCSSSCNKYYT